ncbi:hypothetical protein TBLA_0E01970 [Henningerozyma blattae CBS 6284]|uniref:Major facilitator superfamily (MFS) profile domain-containing protein n=1 Tax=Henningerozyma blattae (strain ATCC 34711 / CBS 6284 / DSM 70876 / NBRC 10599 / NRRL Y-10934 / UCD 77-7) TaxID=1071380 RepID=I2H4E8_HENB6|nr:hypothetical protein TBLA_0E01970 [Tetrapisispora blattae CBS 6284]CCH61250.1 hypothetical protein TBLA_0E01970 [Tetrapisispora blattae CBS 6284]
MSSESSNNENSLKVEKEITQKNDATEYQMENVKFDAIPGIEVLYSEESPEALVEPEKNKWKYTTVCIMCLMVAFGGFMTGWDIGTIGGFMAQTDFIRRFGTLGPNNVYYLSKIRMGLLVSIFNIGCAVGSVTLGKLGDIYGRRWGLILATIIFVIGVLIEITSVDKWYQYFIGRIIAGIGMGLIAVLSPMLISEVAPKELRGAMVSCYQLMITFGIFLGNCCNYGTKSYSNSAQWRIGVGLQFLWSIIMVCAMMFVPESPRYLIQKGKTEQAKISIARSNKVDIDSVITQREFEIVYSAVEAEREAGVAGWKEIFETKNKTFQRVLMGMVVLGLQQLSGANYFFYYGSTIFNAVGLDDAFQTAIIFGVVNFASTFVALYVVDKFGRRLCLLVGAAALSCCMLVFATIGVTSLYPNGWDSPTSKWAGDVMIVFSCLFIFFFATSWAPIPFVILSETFPLRIRSKGMALGTVSNQLWNFMVGFFTPWITGAIHFYYGYVFLGCCVFAFFYVFFFVPETKGLVLEDINLLWEEGVPPWKSVAWVPPSQREEYLSDINSDEEDKFNIPTLTSSQEQISSLVK